MGGRLEQGEEGVYMGERMVAEMVTSYRYCSGRLNESGVMEANFSLLEKGVTHMETQKTRMSLWCWIGTRDFRELTFSVEIEKYRYKCMHVYVDTYTSLLVFPLRRPKTEPRGSESIYTQIMISEGHFPLEGTRDPWGDGSLQVGLGVSTEVLREDGVQVKVRQKQLDRAPTAPTKGNLSTNIDRNGTSL